MKSVTMNKIEMETANEQPEDKVIFAPLEDIDIIRKVIVNLEMTRSELRAVAEGMKPIE